LKRWALRLVCGHAGEARLRAERGHRVLPGVAVGVDAGVVGHDPLDPVDPQVAEVLGGSKQESGARRGLLVAVDLGA
jgi:hypothetical protein